MNDKMLITKPHVFAHVNFEKKTELYYLYYF